MGVAELGQRMGVVGCLNGLLVAIWVVLAHWCHIHVVMSCCLHGHTVAWRDELGTRQYLRVHYLSAPTVVRRDALLPKGYRLGSALW